MTASIDKMLHWTDHYVEYGFAVVKKAIGRDFIDPALEEVKRFLKTDLPFDQWTANNGCAGHFPYDGKNFEVLPRVYDQPGLRQIIDTMFGSPERWNGERMFQLFVSSYNPEADPKLAPMGHLDFVRCPIPILGSGFMFQVSLIDSEPHSGNITIYPGTHKKIIKRLQENPDLQYPQDLQDDLYAEPYEFVAEAGDVLLFHHLVGHQGNQSHAANRTPRIVIHGQGLAKEWLAEVDPDQPGISPWERSLATNGKYHVREDEQEMRRRFEKQDKSPRERVYGNR